MANGLREVMMAVRKKTVARGLPRSRDCRVGASALGKTLLLLSASDVHVLLSAHQELYHSFRSLLSHISTLPYTCSASCTCYPTSSAGLNTDFSLYLFPISG